MNRISAKGFLGVVAPLLIGIFAVAIFFRYQLTNGFTVLTGNRYDQVIQLAIMEHWRNTFIGAARWSETGYFYPVKSTIAYNDGYFIFGAIYSVFRSFSLDPYLSGELLNVSLRLIGFAAFYLMGKRILRLELAWALLAATLFTVSNNLFIEGSHGQLFGVCFVPVMVLLIDAFLISLLKGTRAAIVCWGIGASAFYAAWLMTTFYMAWYFMFFSVFWFAAYILLGGWKTFRFYIDAIRSQIVAILVVVAALVLFNLPFLRVYLPKARETGMHGFDEVNTFTLSPLDLVHVGYDNLLYGRIVHILNDIFRPGFPSWSEQMTGFPPILLFFFLVGSGWTYTHRKIIDRERMLLLCSVALAALFTWALAIRIDGLTPWWFVYSYFPGAKAARAVARYQIFLAAPVIIIAVSYLAYYEARIIKPVVALLALLLFVEQLNTGAAIELNRDKEMQRLTAVPPPPAGCIAFFVTHARPEGLFPDDDSIYSHNVDAMIISEVIRVPTLNGYSTFVPPDWHLVNPEDPDYLQRVKSFASLHRLSNLCQLDLRAMAWKSDPFAATN